MQESKKLEEEENEELYAEITDMLAELTEEEQEEPKPRIKLQEKVNKTLLNKGSTILKPLHEPSLAQLRLSVAGTVKKAKLYELLNKEAESDTCFGVRTIAQRRLKETKAGIVRKKEKS